MRIQTILLALLLSLIMFTSSFAQELPLVYDVENTCEDCPLPSLPTFADLPTIEALPDPFLWSDGEGRMASFVDWRYRRGEIVNIFEYYEIGEKPGRPDSIEASYSNGTLTVHVTVNGNTLTLTSAVALPEGAGPFPAVIGMGSSTGSIPSGIFTSRDIARITFNFGQVMQHTQVRGSEPINQLYPDLTYIGAYSAWPWGVSRLIDGLELVADDLPIDLKHLAVTGCSFAGKMALYSGALDERIALTIAQESGGGGSASWRVSQTLGNVETLSATNDAWFSTDVTQFSLKVSKLPFDHHELMAMVAPRALFIIGNPSQEWLAEESGYVSSEGAKRVYESLGIPDRFGFSFVTDHAHCALPTSQEPEVEAFVEKFLLGDTSANTEIRNHPYSTNLDTWIDWDNPALSNDSTFYGWSLLVYPADLQLGLDTTDVSFMWTRNEDADKYIFQIATDPHFTNIALSDSTTDTLKTIPHLSGGTKYFWRVRVKNSEGATGLWSDIRTFSTFVPLPASPQLVSSEQVPDQVGSVTLKWRSVDNADEYLVQVSRAENFSLVKSLTTSDTMTVVDGIINGRNYYWRVQAINVSGSGTWSNTGDFNIIFTGIEETDGIPKEYSISQNYPNPFNPSTRIQFSLPKAGHTKLIIYDLLGREIQTLINRELAAGIHEINVDAGNLPSGIYLYRIQSGDFIQARKMILMK